jgi:hypothetical protein
MTHRSKQLTNIYGHNATVQNGSHSTLADFPEYSLFENGILPNRKTGIIYH